MRKLQIPTYICRSVCQIDMKFDRQLRPATETSWVVSYGGKTIPRWQTATILKIVISPYLSEKFSAFDEILYSAADFELDERHVIKNKKKLHWTDSEFNRTYFLLWDSFYLHSTMPVLCMYIVQYWYRYIFWLRQYRSYVIYLYYHRQCISAALL